MTGSAGTKRDQIKQIGNAVCPKLAEALIETALPDFGELFLTKAA